LAALFRTKKGNIMAPKSKTTEEKKENEKRRIFTNGEFKL